MIEEETQIYKGVEEETYVELEEGTQEKDQEQEEEKA